MVFDGIAYPNPDQVALGGLHPWTRHAAAKGALEAWFDEAREATWAKPQDIKDRYRSASFLADNRLIFKIRGEPLPLGRQGALPERHRAHRVGRHPRPVRQTAFLR
jgi:hypothetical protein